MFTVSHSDSSIYVEMSVDGSAQMQEFPAGQERAFVVGSTVRADFCIGAPGVAAVQFHLERDEGSLWLIPAYNVTELRLDGHRVLGPTPVERCSVVDFCGVRMQLRLTESDGLSASDDRLSVRSLKAAAGQQGSFTENFLGQDDVTLVATRPMGTSDVRTPDGSATFPKPIERTPRYNDRAFDRRAEDRRAKPFLLLASAVVLALTLLIAVRLWHQNRGTEARPAPSRSR